MKRIAVIGCITLSVAIAPVSCIRAATIVVTSTNDSGAGTLRAALGSATNAGDAITFALPSPSLIKLASQLTISNSINILGPGPTNLAIMGGFLFRVFTVMPSQTVTIASLTITNGKVATGIQGGGGIFNNHSTLTVSNCVIVGNSAATSGAGGLGGGIYNLGFGPGNAATVTVVNTSFRNNSAFTSGGAIESNGGNSGHSLATVIGSSFVGNSTTVFGRGGALDNNGEGGSAIMTVIASTFADNRAASRGGGICNDGGGNTFGTVGTAKVTVVACTFATNAFVSGSVTNSDNIYNQDISGTAVVEIADSILYGAGTGWNITNVSPGIVISDGYNLSDDNGGGFLAATGDQINTNPQLGSLQNNGGPTLTYALLAGSPAIDQGNTGVIPSLARNTDQRGEPRYDDPNVANASGGDGSDIGAYEVASLRVTSVATNGNDFRVSFTSTLGTNYFVQSVSDLSTGTWTTVAGPIPGNGGIAQSTQTNALSQPQQFYKIQLPP